MTGKYANVADRQLATTQPPNSIEIFPVDDGYVVAAPVGQFLPNGFGLYDMIGNLGEWCSDEYIEDAYDQAGAHKSTGLRVVRGGSYMSALVSARCAAREGAKPNENGLGVGFRVLIEDDRDDHSEGVVLGPSAKLAESAILLRSSYWFLVSAGAVAVISLFLVLRARRQSKISRASRPMQKL